MAQPPASVRYNNPGAMYPGPVADRFGSTGTEIIGGGHKIAVFPDPVSGAAAQFALLDRGYAGMTIADAIKKWSGGNHSDAYARRVAEQTGIDPGTRLTPEMLRDPNFAVPLARTMAGWEAGNSSPLSDDDWRAAHGMAFNGQQPPPRSSGHPAPTTPSAAPETTVATAAPPAASPPADSGPIGALMGSLFPQAPSNDPNAQRNEQELMKNAVAMMNQTRQQAGYGQQQGAMQPTPQRPLDMGKIRAMIARRVALGTGGEA